MFESTFFPTRQKERGRRALVALPVAIGIHVLALGGAVVGQLFAFQPVPDAVVMVAFWASPTPPPAEPTRDGPRPGKAPRAARPLTPPTQIVAVPDPPPEATQTPEEPGEVTGVEGGDPEARGLGSPAGLGSGPGVGPAPVVEEDAPMVIGGAIVKPVEARRVEPIYPEIARRSRVEGLAVVEAIIDRAGNVVDARILRDPGMGCGDAVLQAVRQWRYRPATLNGRAVSVYLTITVNFQLR